MRTLLLVLVVAVTAERLASAGDVSCTAIDLSGLDGCPESGESGESGSVDGDSFFDPQALLDLGESATGPQFYLSGIVGGSFATLSQPDLPSSNAILNQTLLTGGGAAGWAFERPYGFWRTEFEARSRERMQFTEIDPVAGVTSLHARNGWSTMATAWRDINLTDQAGIYVGGGIGAGGYRCAFHGENLGTTVTGTTGITSFAWQAGGGAIYAFSDRVTLDLGYRFFSLGSGSADIYVTNAAGTLHDTVKTQFVASEALLTLRIYEPFRRWR